MEKWFVGILIIVFILSSQIDIKASNEDNEELPEMSEEIEGCIRVDTFSLMLGFRLCKICLIDKSVR